MVALHELGLHNLKRRSRPEKSSQPSVGRSFLCRPWGIAIGRRVPDRLLGRLLFFRPHDRAHPDHVLAPILIVAGAPWLPLVHGLPVGVRRRVMRASCWATGRPLRALGRFLTAGWVAIVLFNMTMVIWHLPALFDLAETNQDVHIWLMHASFFVTGVLFWLQIIPSHPIKPKLGTGPRSGPSWVPTW